MSLTSALLVQPPPITPDRVPSCVARRVLAQSSASARPPLSLRSRGRLPSGTLRCPLDHSVVSPRSPSVSHPPVPLVYRPIPVSSPALRFPAGAVVCPRWPSVVPLSRDLVPSLALRLSLARRVIVRLYVSPRSHAILASPPCVARRPCPSLVRLLSPGPPPLARPCSPPSSVRPLAPGPPPLAHTCSPARPQRLAVAPLRAHRLLCALHEHAP